MSGIPKLAAAKPRLAATGVGSLPHLSVEDGVRDVLTWCPEYPYWPQFPRLRPRESMYRQFSAGLPGVRFAGDDAGGGRLYWSRDSEVQGELERVYADLVALDQAGQAFRASCWGLDPEDAQGLYALREAIGAEKDAAAGRRGVKGQVTGPLSLGLSVTDGSGRALLYEEDLMDGVAQALALRARWQRLFLEALAPDVVVVVDEPYLGTFGSAFFPYRPETVLGYLETFDRTLGGTWGVHCCSNTDWEFLLASPARLVSFDAYSYGDRIALYPEALRRFLAAGKIMAWGVVPTSAADLAAEDEGSLTRRLRGLFERLVARGVPERSLASQSFVTPACGLAGLDAGEAGRAMALTAAVSSALRRELSGAAAEEDKPGLEGW